MFTRRIHAVVGATVLGLGAGAAIFGVAGVASAAAHTRATAPAGVTFQHPGTAAPRMAKEDKPGADSSGIMIAATGNGVKITRFGPGTKSSARPEPRQPG